jgi:hypothetical protein
MPVGDICDGSMERPPLGVHGVGHEPHSLSDMRRADTASWQYGRPHGVTFRFQVSENSVEPAPSDRRFNLLSKDRCRAALADETEPMRP